MTKIAPSLCVAVLERTAFIKVPGRANFASSVDLKNVVQELRDRGFSDFVLDLHECVTMDSTFLGVLAGLVLRNNNQPATGSTPPQPPNPKQNGQHIELLNPNPRVLDLVENLGVLEYFDVKNETVPSTVIFEETGNGAAEPSREEVTKTCLQAHKDLMELNPANIPKFKEVTQFMAEDLKKLSADNK
jgi:anti-sigma B factor antagonist